jgi:hypothetical protein
MPEGMPRGAPSSSCELAGFAARPPDAPLALHPELMLLELAPLLGEMPSLVTLDAIRKSLGVSRPGFDSLFLVALSGVERAHPEPTNENAAAVALVQTVLKFGRWKILLSFGTPSIGARGAQSEKQDAGEKSPTQCLHPIAIHPPLLPPWARAAKETVLN